MEINRTIIAAVVIISAGGVIRIWTGTASPGRTLSQVLIGGFILLLALSVVDLFGEPLSTIAGGLAMLAALVVILNDIPWGMLFSAGHAPTSEQKPASGQNVQRPNLAGSSGRPVQ